MLTNADTMGAWGASMLAASQALADGDAPQAGAHLADAAHHRTTHEAIATVKACNAHAYVSRLGRTIAEGKPWIILAPACAYGSHRGPTGIVGRGASEAEAWLDAASRMEGAQ